MSVSNIRRRIDRAESVLLDLEQHRYVNHAVHLVVYDRRNGLPVAIDESRVYGGVWDRSIQSYTDIWPDSFSAESIPIECHVGQYDAIRDLGLTSLPSDTPPVNRALIHCGRGWGKSSFGILCAICYGFDRPGGKAIFVSPSYPLSQVLQDKMLVEFPLEQFLHPEIGVQKYLRRMNLLTLMTFQFLSADRDTTLRAGDAGIMVVDERQKIRQGRVNAATFQLRKRTDYRIIQVGTPEVGSDFHDERDRYAADSRCVVRSGSSYENCFLPTTLFDDARKTMSQDYCRQEIDGEFVSLAGAVYWMVSKELHVREPPRVATDITRAFLSERLEYGESDVIIGVDYPGYAVVLKLYAPDILYAIREYVHESDTSPAHLAQRLIADGYGGAVIVDDASGEYSQHGVLASRMMRQAGFRVVHRKKNPHVLDRVRSVQAKLCDAATRRVSLFVSKSCPMLIKALLTQEYVGGRPDKDCGYKDDILDALGYPIHRLFPATSVQIPEHPSVKENM